MTIQPPWCSAASADLIRSEDGAAPDWAVIAMGGIALCLTLSLTLMHAAGGLGGRLEHVLGVQTSSLAAVEHPYLPAEPVLWEQTLQAMHDRSVSDLLFILSQQAQAGHPDSWHPFERDRYAAAQSALEAKGTALPGTWPDLLRG